MKSKFVLILLVFLPFFIINAQNYNPVINYSYNGTPSQGIKIKTTLPYVNGVQMPTIIIEGYNYGQSKTIGLTLVWYIYAGSFYSPKISSFGDYTPPVKLANENGYVVIFIDDRQYYNRFSIRAFATGMGEPPSWFSNWSITDEPIYGTNITNVPYGNSFVNLSVKDWTLTHDSWPGNGGFTFSGNDVTFGIHSTAGQASLQIDGAFIQAEPQKTNYFAGQSRFNNNVDVNGTIHAREVKVDLTGWSDFVFKPTYKLRSLPEIEQFIKTYGHLPEIPSAKEVEENGVSIGEMQAKLLQKIEELTMYSIEQDKKLQEQAQKNAMLEQEVKELKELLMKKLK